MGEQPFTSGDDEPEWESDWGDASYRGHQATESLKDTLPPERPSEPPEPQPTQPPPVVSPDDRR